MATSAITKWCVRIPKNDSGKEAFQSGARKFSPNRDEANRRKGYRDKPEIEPHSIAIGSLRPVPKLDHQPRANSQTQGHANEIAPRGVCGKEGRSRYAEASRNLGPG